MLSAKSEWKPIFNDKPVTAEHSAAIDAALPTELIAPVIEPRRLLVVSSTSGFRHRSIPTGKEALTKLGKSTGAFETVISDDPANFEPEVLKTFDAVVLLSTTQDFFMPSRKKRNKFSKEEWETLALRHNRLIDNLVAFVNQGGGLIGIHAATDSCYGHKQYGDMIGGYFNGHPWNSKARVVINVEDPKHELNKPVFGEQADFEIVEEIYQFRDEPYSRERLRILLGVDVERSDQVKGLKRKDGDYPVAWVQSVGEGRVFYTSIGHNDSMFYNPLVLKHYLAGIQFACGDLRADTTPSAKIDVPHVAGCSCH
ncbi:MAG: ThuA domain-containing protein [Coraliomargarita sp.]